jgi:hypothetical protein
MIFHPTYPWLQDTAVTNAWIAEKEYITTATGVSSWAPQKGSISLAQATGGSQPIFSSNSWNSKLGGITFDGIDDILTGDSLAALVTGSDLPWSCVAVFQYTTATAGKNTFSFSNTSDTQSYMTFSCANSAGAKHAIGRIGDSGTQLNGIVSNFIPNVGYMVLTIVFTGTALTMRVNGTATNVAASGLDTVASTLSKFQIGGFRGASTLYSNPMVFRGFIFGNSAWSSSTYLPIENYFVNETLNTSSGIVFNDLVRSVQVIQAVQSDIGVTVATGVSTWTDISGNAKNYTQGTGANQPSYSTTTLNGFPVLTFDGSNDSLSATLALPLAGTTPTYLAMVMRQVAWVAGGCIIGDTQTGANFPKYVNEITSTPNLQAFNGVARNNSAATLGNWVLVEVYWSNTTADFFKIGSTNVTGVAMGNSGVSTGRSLGFGSGTGQFNWSGEIAMVMYCSGLPSAAERAALADAVTVKYGGTVGV